MCLSDKTAAKCTQGSGVQAPVQKITDEVIIAYLHCKYKAYLILTDVAREPSDRERWLRSFETKYIEAATKALLDRESHGCTSSNSEPATTNSLAQGETIVLNLRVEEDSLLFVFDALQRVTGASSLGLFHYVPVMFCGTGRSVSKMHRVLLACGALILEKLQRVRPAYGIVIHGHSYKIRKVILDSEFMNAQKVINDLTDYLCRHKKPRLWLNNHCHVCRYRSECRAEAKQLDDLSLLNRMSEREIQLYNRKGIFSVHQLSHTFRFKKRAKRVKAHGRPHSFPLQALAIRERSVFALSRPAIQPASTYIYVDMEGNHTGSFIYLIGALVVDDDSTRYHSFWANSVHEEEYLFAEFIQFITQFNNAHLFHYGSYEAKAFRRILIGSAENKGKLLMMSATNILSLVYANVYFPTYSNELKEIGKYLGCEWSDPDSTGLSAAIWRAQWESSNDANLKNRLIAYNEQDCLAVQRVREFLSAMPENNQVQEVSDGRIRFVGRVKIDDDERLFGKRKFAVEDFSIVTERAYFDYQRDKVYIRTNPSLKRVKQRAKRKRKRYRLRPNKVVNLRSLRCRYCRSSNIFRDYTNFRSRDSLNLRVSLGNIRRWITHYRAPYHRCNACKRTFIPKTLRVQRRFGHNLVAWVIDQYVSNRISFENLERTLKDNFALPIRLNKIHKFKSYAARYYAVTYNNILKGLMDGVVIHADETKINFKIGSGYVWVFANMEYVYYLYKSGREADFLHETLRDFRGVLVSDFYTGYDSLPCPQQKCLVHLIRDINDDILKNPFDPELKEVAMLFGNLVRSVVLTIDDVGLKASRLSKFKPRVEEFIRLLALKDIRSEIAQKYCKRILKYESKLFTFLEHDGVPWNNNNAEHAVKYFAKYRRLINGRITESGLKDYLVLLSIYQTCRYREINFLDFLLSKDRDIDCFDRATIGQGR